MPYSVVFLYIICAILLIIILRIGRDTYGLNLSLKTTKDVQTYLGQNIIELAHLYDSLQQEGGLTSEKLRHLTAQQLTALKALNSKIESTKNTVTNFSQELLKNIEQLSRNREYPIPQTFVLPKVSDKDEMQANH